jgi:hypothetical protein
LEAGVGPKNITNNKWNWLYSNSVAKNSQLVNITLTEGDVYKIEAYCWPYGTNGKTSQEYWYEVVCEGNKTPIELAWKNEYGGYDYFNFNRVSTHVVTSDKETYIKNRYGLSKYSNVTTDYARGETVIRNEIQDNYILNTNMLTSNEAELLQDLMVSSDVYMYESGEWSPVILNTSNFVIKTNALGFKQYTIEVRKANRRNVVR